MSNLTELKQAIEEQLQKAKEGETSPDMYGSFYASGCRFAAEKFLSLISEVTMDDVMAEEFGPPPDSLDSKEWMRVLKEDMEKLRKLNPPVSEETLHRRFTI